MADFLLRDNFMYKLPILKPGDKVDIVAPASRCSVQRLNQLTELLTSWQLDYRMADDTFGDDLLCANSDAMRWQCLKNALQNTETTAIICAQGGYGSARLIPELAKIAPITPAKLFIGMSDMTALNLFFQQKWQWPVIHAAVAPDRFSPESIATLKALMFGEIAQLVYEGTPLNLPAQQNASIASTVTGGNLCLLQASIGTCWQIDGRDKIILLEETGERAYRVDRMLEHLRQAGIFTDAAAILLGDFVGGAEPNGTSLIKPVLERFAQSCKIPVLQVAGVGHGNVNFPIPLATKSRLILGDQTKLICQR
jgi:muramoyltetrapeptide carboxypeptidase